MRWKISYDLCLTLGASDSGLYISTVFPLSVFAHPPLFVPWTDISVKPVKGIIFTYAGFRFRGAPGVPFIVSAGLAEEIIGLSGAK